MESLETRMEAANEALENAKAEHAAELQQATIEFHGLDLTSRAHAVDEEKLADTNRATALAALPAAKMEANRLRKLINTDFTPARNNRVKAYNKALDEANRLECLSREFGYYAHRATVCRYRADLLS